MSNSKRAKIYFFIVLEDRKSKIKVLASNVAILLHPLGRQNELFSYGRKKKDREVKGE